MVTDPIGDMLTRIRNAVAVGKRVVEIPASGLKQEIAKILVGTNFVKKYVVIDDGKQGMIKILLKYTEGVSTIQGIQRISVPGRRQYSKSDEIPKVKNGLGIAIVSTSKGVITDRQARELNVGGEVLCRVW
jgi:small subunit ribosomal protein S8